MLFRKKWFSNFIWILAMIILIVMGAQYAFLYGIDFLFADEDSILSQWTSASYNALDAGLIIWIVVFMGLCVGLYFLLRAICGFIKSRFHGSEYVVNIIRIILVCAVFITAILYRGYIFISSDTVILKDSTYYDAAVSILKGEGDISELAVHGASYVYISIMSFIMQFLGDRVIAAVLLQIIIQLLTIVLTFATFKSLVNYTCGLTASAVLAVSPVYISRLFTADPGCFTALLVVAGMYLVSCIFRTDGVLKTILGLVLGIVAGYTIYLDVTVVLLFIPWLFCLIHEAAEEEPHNYLAAYLLMIAGVVLGTAGSIFLDGGFDQDGISIAAQTFFKVARNSLHAEYALLDSTMGLAGLILCMILICAASFSIMGFFGRDYIEFELPWVMMIACAMTPMTRIGYLQDNMTSFVCYLMMVGAGVSALIYVKPAVKVPVAHTPASGAGTPAASKPKQDAVSDTSAQTQTVPLSQSLKEQMNKTPDTQEAKPAPAEKPASAVKQDVGSDTSASAKTEPETNEEGLPTSISWASIKALDDDPVDIYGNSEEEEEGDTVLSSPDRNYDVIVEGADLSVGEAYAGDEEDEEDEADTGRDEAVETDDKPEKADSSTVSETDTEDDREQPAASEQVTPVETGTDVISPEDDYRLKNEWDFKIDDDDTLQFESLDDIAFEDAEAGSDASKTGNSGSEGSGSVDSDESCSIETDSRDMDDYDDYDDDYYMSDDHYDPVPLEKYDEAVKEDRPAKPVESELEPVNPKPVSAAEVEPVSAAEPEPVSPAKPEPETSEDDKVIDPDTVQVDDLPGMIPNPVPLPPKKKHVPISFDDNLDDLEDADYDLDYDDADDSDYDVDDEDDFDI